MGKYIYTLNSIVVVSGKQNDSGQFVVSSIGMPIIPQINEM